MKADHEKLRRVNGFILRITELAKLSYGSIFDGRKPLIATWELSGLEELVNYYLNKYDNVELGEDGMIILKEGE